MIRFRLNAPCRLVYAGRTQMLSNGLHNPGQIM